MPLSLFDEFDCDFITIHTSWELINLPYYLEVKDKIHFSSFKSNIKLKFKCKCKKWSSAKGCLEFLFARKGKNNGYKITTNIFIVFLYYQDCNRCNKQGKINFYRETISNCLNELFIKLLKEKVKDVSFDDRESNMKADHDKFRCELCKMGIKH